MSRYKQIFLNTFRFDLRSLALTRIFLSLIVLSDLIIRALDFEAHYTDFGVLPRQALLELGWEEWFISIHMLSGNYYIQLALFIITAVFVCTLLAGYRTTLSTVITWILLISLHNRNPVVLQGGDVLLRCLLFWGIFIPWSERFSIDQLRRSNRKLNENRIYSLSAFAFVIQLSIMYVSTALLKTGHEWTRDYSAIYYTLSLDQFRILLGNVIYSYPLLMKSLTFATYWLELLGTVLFFIPLKTGHFRVVGIILFTVFQAGLLLTMRLGLFPLISLAALLILLPPGFWDYASGLEKTLSGIREYICTFFNNRGLITYTTSVNTETGKKLMILKSAVVIFFMIFVIYWNISTATGIYGLSRNTVWLGHLLRIDQKWDMFAPSPFKDDGWYVMPGTLRNGKRLDVFRKSQINWDKPRDAIVDYKTYRWRKYMRRLWIAGYSGHRLYYGKYICRKWNRDSDYMDNLMSFDIYFMKEKTLSDYKTAEIEKVLIWEHRCF